MVIVAPAEQDRQGSGEILFPVTKPAGLTIVDPASFDPGRNRPDAQHAHGRRLLRGRPDQQAAVASGEPDRDAVEGCCSRDPAARLDRLRR